MENPKRFFAVAAALVGGMMGSAALLNGTIDAYGLYRWAEIKGLNANKPLQAFHERIVRGADIPRLEPDALILGTSRAQIGLDPSHPDFGRAQRVYNSALSDGTPYEALRYLQHAQAQRPVKRVVVAPDFLSYAGPSRKAPDFTEERIAVDPRNRPNLLHRFSDAASTLLSLDALRSSRRTLLDQRLPSYFRPDGRRDEFTQNQRVTSEGGPRGTFLWSERDYLKNYACFEPFSSAAESSKVGGWKNSVRASENRSGAVEDFRELLAFAQGQGIEVRALTSPSHARAQLLIEAAGLWDDYERWKRELLQSLSALGIPWIEFGGADPRFTAEEVPPPGDAKSRMRWYWESSHYRKELGDIALHRVLTGEEAPGAEGFGVALTPKNLELQLARIRSELATWKAAHPADWEELRSAAQEVFAEERVHCLTRLAVAAE